MSALVNRWRRWTIHFDLAPGRVRAWEPPGEGHSCYLGIENQAFLEILHCGLIASQAINLQRVGVEIRPAVRVHNQPGT